MTTEIGIVFPPFPYGTVEISGPRITSPIEVFLPRYHATPHYIDVLAGGGLPYGSPYAFGFGNYIEFPGSGPSPTPVPELGTWLLVTIGFGLLFAAKRLVKL
jgi:hypothetical protein